jgi:predicted TIM-barrel fold metal-dependent hydrolase
VLGAAAAGVAGLTTIGRRAAAERPDAGSGAATRSRLIDVHHHLFPPAMADALHGKLPDFSLPGVERSLHAMDADGTTTALISFPNSDIVEFDEQRLASLIRSSNDYAADLVAKHRGRYGLFASLPMPHADASLKELRYALDELHAHGILLITNYRNNWLGDALYAPVLEELNRRGTVVFMHPNAADCCKGLVPGLSDSIVEFETDTARTIASLLFSGAAERYRNIRFVFSHAGGTMPALIDRFTNATKVSPGVTANVPRGALAYLQSFHYDTAQAANASALGALLQFVPAAQVVFGTDFPYRGAAEQVASLRAMGLSTGNLADILAGNSLRLIPNLS